MTNDQELVAVIKAAKAETQAQVQAVIDRPNFVFTNDTVEAVLEAVKTRRLHLLPILLSKHDIKSGISLDTWTSSGETALELAWNDEDTCKILLEHGASKKRILDPKDETELLKAKVRPIKELTLAIIVGGKPLTPYGKPIMQNVMNAFGNGLARAYKHSIFDDLEIAMMLLCLSLVLSQHSTMFQSAINADSTDKANEEKLLAQLVLLTIIAIRIGPTSNDECRLYQNETVYRVFNMDTSRESKLAFVEQQTDMFLNKVLTVNTELHEKDRIMPYYDFVRGTEPYAERVEKYLKPKQPQ